MMINKKENEVEYLLNLRIYNDQINEENLDHFIDGARRNDPYAYESLTLYLLKTGKLILIKYYVILKDFGASTALVVNYYKEFVFDFICALERKYNNFENYFKGYIVNRFKDLLRSYDSNSNKVIRLTTSLELTINKEGENPITLLQCLASDDDIVEDYNLAEFFDRFVTNDSSPLDEIEKKVVVLRYKGYSFKEIAEELKLTYKKVVSIYHQIVLKIKN